MYELSEIDDVQSESANLAAQKLENHREFKIVMRVMTKQLQFKSICPKAHHVLPAKIRLYLTALGFFRHHSIIF